MRNWLATAAVALSLGMSANSVSAQRGAGVPALQSPSTTGTAPQAPIGHRQPTGRDVPPDLASRTNGAAPSARAPHPSTPRDIVLTAKTFQDLASIERYVNETIKPMTDLDHWGIIELGHHREVALPGRRLR
jgi:predicted transglutaminase-like cysteine proteinase